MSDLSNTAVVSAFISLLLAAFAAIWALYKNSESTRHKERVEAYQKMLQIKEEGEQKHDQAIKDQILYQQNLISEQKKELNDLKSQYYELGSSLLPALTTTEKTLSNISKMIEKISNHEK